MKKILTVIIMILLTTFVMAQKRTMDTIVFVKGGLVYKIITYPGYVTINDQTYYSFPSTNNLWSRIIGSTNNAYNLNSGNLGIGTSAPPSKLSIQNNSDDYPTLGSERLSGSGWTSTDWTGNNTTGWDHLLGTIETYSLTLNGASGGTGYTVGNMITVTGGNNNAQYTVAMINGSTGAIIAMTRVSKGTGYYTGGMFNTTGGSGTGCTMWVSKAGNTTSVTNTLAAEVGKRYHISYTCELKAGVRRFKITFGGQTSWELYATSGSFDPTATTTGGLIITPMLETFDRKITISIKEITGFVPASLSYLSSSGTVINEQRLGTTAGNFYFGTNSGRYTTSGGSNIGIGNESLRDVTSGFGNICIGGGSGYYLTTGSSNINIGAWPYNVQDAWGRLGIGIYGDSTEQSIYGDMFKNWYRINGTLLVKTIPTALTQPSYALAPTTDGLLQKYAWPTTSTLSPYDSLPWYHNIANKYTRLRNTTDSVELPQRVFFKNDVYTTNELTGVRNGRNQTNAKVSLGFFTGSASLKANYANSSNVWQSSAAVNVNASGTAASFDLVSGTSNYSYMASVGGFYSSPQNSLGTSGQPWGKSYFADDMLVYSPTTSIPANIIVSESVNEMKVLKSVPYTNFSLSTHNHGTLYEPWLSDGTGLSVGWYQLTALKTNGGSFNRFWRSMPSAGSIVKIDPVDGAFIGIADNSTTWNDVLWRRVSGTTNNTYNTNTANVGVGTTSPSAKLTVVGNNGNDIVASFQQYPTNTIDKMYFMNKGYFASTHEFGLFNSLDLPVLVYNYDNDKLHLGSQICIDEQSSKIGIGNFSPTSKLDITAAGGTSATSWLRGKIAGGATLAYFRDDGNIGFGTTSPTSKLEVVGTTKTTDLIITNPVLTAGPYSVTINSSGVYPPTSSMVYPGAGIPLSTGSAWGTSITNNSANWNTAFGWGDWSSAVSLKAPLASPSFTGTVTLSSANATTLKVTGKSTMGVTSADSSIYSKVKANGNSGTAISIYASQGNNQTITRTGNCTYTIVGMVAGQTLTLVMVHEASATAYSVAFSPTFIYSAGTAPTWTNTSGAVDVITIKYDGTRYLAMQSTDFK